MSGYDIELLNEKTNNEFVVKNFKGPIDSPYEGVSEQERLGAILTPEAVVSFIRRPRYEMLTKFCCVCVGDVASPCVTL